jgi:hypothetical protein
MRGAISDAEIASNSDAEFGCGALGVTVVGRRFLTQNSGGVVGRCGGTAEFASNSGAFFASKNGGRA